jgi:transcriptional regulator with XRE-family HTH domain
MTDIARGGRTDPCDENTVVQSTQSNFADCGFLPRRHTPGSIRIEVHIASFASSLGPKRQRMKCLNIIGPQVRRLRYVRGWSQNMLAAKITTLRLGHRPVGLAKIESRLVHVDDYELLYLSKVFNVSLADLFPAIDPSRRLHEVITELIIRNPSKKRLRSESEAGWVTTDNRQTLPTR